MQPACPNRTGLHHGGPPADPGSGWKSVLDRTSSIRLNYPCKTSERSALHRESRRRHTANFRIPEFPPAHYVLVRDKRRSSIDAADGGKFGHSIGIQPFDRVCHDLGRAGPQSSESSGGRRNGVSAPNCSATAAISRSSVDTITRSNNPDCRAAAMEYAIIGRPANGRMFFRGIRLLPPRAGMTAIFKGLRKCRNHFCWSAPSASGTAAT